MFCVRGVLKNSQNSQENTCNVIKKENLAQVFFCEFCDIFKSTFYKTPLVAASVKYGHTVNAKSTQGLLQLFYLLWLKNI